MANIKVHFILDKSGSMQSVKQATISGFNEYVQTLKNDKENKYKMSVTLFDTETQQLYAGKGKMGTKESVKLETVMDLESVELNEDNYVPDGMTALYDAACRVMNDVRNEKGKNLVVIMTDGEENSSREYTQEQFKSLVKELEGKERWTFVYLGANQDAWAVAQRYGFSQGNVANYKSTPEDVKVSMRAMAGATMAFSAMSASNTNSFLASNKDAEGNIKE